MYRNIKDIFVAVETNYAESQRLKSNWFGQSPGLCPHKEEFNFTWILKRLKLCEAALVQQEGEERQTGQKGIKRRGRTEKLRQRQWSKDRKRRRGYLISELNQSSDERTVTNVRWRFGGREWLDIYWPWLNSEGERPALCLLTGSCRPQCWTWPGPLLRFNTVGGKHTSIRTQACMQGACIHTLISHTHANTHQLVKECSSV